MSLQKPVLQSGTIPDCLTRIDRHPFNKSTAKIASIHAIYEAETVLLAAFRVDAAELPRGYRTPWTTEAWRKWLEAMMQNRVEEGEVAR